MKEIQTRQNTKWRRKRIAHKLLWLRSGKWEKSILPNPALTIGAILIVTLAVGIVDLLTGPRISFALFYLLPVGAAAWLVSRTAGFLVAAFAALAWLGCDIFSGAHDAHTAIPWWNALMRYGVFSIVVLLISELRLRTQMLDFRVEARTRSLRRAIAERKRIEREVFDLLQRQKQSIAHELHDDLAQFLTGLSLKTKALEEDLRASFSSHADSADRIVQLLNEAVGRTREIARGLSPTEIDAGELISALRRLTSEIEDTYKITCSLRSSHASLPMAQDTGTHLFRIAQQAIDNAIRHGSPTCIRLNLQADGSQLRLTITDNGRGFGSDGHPKAGLGLRIMRFRAELLGGTLALHSVPGDGVRLECSVPIT